MICFLKTRQLVPRLIISTRQQRADNFYLDPSSFSCCSLTSRKFRSLAISKVAGDLQWNLVINALEQANESEVLSAPRVVTLDGSTAVIQVGEERMVPKSFEVSNQDTSPCGA